VIPNAVEEGLLNILKNNMSKYFQEHDYSDGSISPASHYFSYLLPLNQI